MCRVNRISPGLKEMHRKAFGFRDNCRSLNCVDIDASHPIEPVLIERTCRTSLPMHCSADIYAPSTGPENVNAVATLNMFLIPELERLSFGWNSPAFILLYVPLTFVSPRCVEFGSGTTLHDNLSSCLSELV